MTDYYINGPVNISRLEGNIEGNTKVVYLFGDIHLSLSNQNKCQTTENKNITHFFDDIFSQNTEIDYDLLNTNIIELFTRIILYINRQLAYG